MWGSDAIAEAIVELGFEFAAINPGASYRGLHDSLVNHVGSNLELVLCLHEEHAVAAAHGWSKVTGKPSLAIVHSNVGLLHASMAIYNAWVDRAPVVILGATGPMDAARRRPWIEWIHTVQDQPGLVRPFTKWDDQPASAAAAVESLRQAQAIAATGPKGPVYVCLDVGYQESRIEEGEQPRGCPPLRTVAPSVGRAEIEGLAARCASARRPLLLFGRLSRETVHWEERQALAQRLGAAVITDIKTAGAFPHPHPLVVGSPGFTLDAQQREALAQADLLLAFDWIDLPGTLALRASKEGVHRVAIGLEPYAQRGWVKDGYGFARVEQQLAGCPDRAVEDLLAALARENRPQWHRGGRDAERGRAEHSLSAEDAYGVLAEALAALRTSQPFVLSRLPLAWPASLLRIEGPLDYLGRDGGEGLASGPGMALGVALALRGSERIAIAVIGDGDFMMGATALWTAAACSLPLVIVVAANGVYGNDVVHQEKVARERGRPLENKWVGQCIDEPRIDIAGLARAQGFAYARRTPPGAELTGIVAEAAAHARLHGPALIELDMPAGRS